MKLYFFPIAPNPTKVRLYLAEKADAGRPIDLEMVQVNLPAGEQKSEAHLARSPFGKVPVLEFDDGTNLTESLAIIEYLEELHPEPPMIGSDARERARARELERIADLGALVSIARIVHATNSPLGLPPNPELAAAAREPLLPALGYLEAQLADGRDFVAGARPTVADCTLAAGLQFGRFGKVFDEMPLAPEHPALTEWDERYRAREAARSVLVT
jgi:glutathione S-transferase